MDAKPLVTVVVDRSRWYRGQSSKDSRLLREDGQMCCLGFACLALGASRDDIFNRSRPAQLTGSVARLFVSGHGGIWTDATDAADAMRTNDDKFLDEPERERRIIGMGRRLGLAFVFVDGPVETPTAPPTSADNTP